MKMQKLKYLTVLTKHIPGAKMTLQIINEIIKGGILK